MLWALKLVSEPAFSSKNLLIEGKDLIEESARESAEGGSLRISFELAVSQCTESKISVVLKLEA